ncbi:MAG: NAD-dependent epimerase/dehydratase family protein [Candidatus Eisenbacteria sp.]|nr:NAD-dependent epimerase/dehydratase family protein [Candidatus Eisenbacteria bacterium]
MAVALVTGVAGFIGSHLAARLLAEGIGVRGIDDFDPYYDRSLKQRNLAPLRAEPGFQWQEGDLGSVPLAPLLAGVDVVYHLAARPGVRHSWGAPFADYVRINITATQRLLEALRETPVARLVFASSSSVYGEQVGGETPESATCLPISPYGVSKLAAEALVRAYHASYGLPGIALRYFTVYGPRQRPDMALHRFVRALLEDRELVLFGDGTQTRDFTYVDDVVAATLAAARVGRPGMVYNIGGGSPASLNDLLAILERVTGRPPRVRREARPAGDPQATRADTRRAREELAFQPTVSLEEGLRRMTGWMTELLAGAAPELARPSGPTGVDHRPSGPTGADHESD